MSTRLQKCALMFVLAIGTSQSAQADIINYADLESPGMLFTNVTESSVNDALPLFGAPTVDGNSLVFSNPGFAATAMENELTFLDGRMTVTVTAKNNQSITSVVLSEYGSFSNTGTDIDVSVSAIAFAIAGDQIYQNSFQFNNDVAGNGEWSADLVINFDSPVSSFSFVADNQLFAQAGVGSTAFIDKENVRLTITTIPEPTLALPIWIALTGTLHCRRRR